MNVTQTLNKVNYLFQNYKHYHILQKITVYRCFDN